MTTMQEMVKAVKQYATDHYNEGGWDSIVECYNDARIEREIAGCKTIKEAIAKVGKGCKLWNERLQDALAEIF